VQLFRVWHEVVRTQHDVNQSWLENPVFSPLKTLTKPVFISKLPGFFPNFEFDFLLIHQKSEEYDKK
jgi:hypothetical protein